MNSQICSGVRFKNWRCISVAMLVVGACCWSAIFAQGPYSPPSYWANVYGGTEFEDAFSVVQMSDGGFVVGGTTTSFGAGSQDFWVLKLTADGAIEWQRSYGGDGNEMLVAMRRAPDGGVIVAGYTDTAAFSAGMSDFWIVKLNPSGDIEWEYAYGEHSRQTLRCEASHR